MYLDLAPADIGENCHGASITQFRLYTEALALYRQVGSLYDVSNVLQDLAFAFSGLGQLDEAITKLGEALSIARRLGSPHTIASALNDLGWLHTV